MLRGWSSFVLCLSQSYAVHVDDIIRGWCRGWKADMVFIRPPKFKQPLQAVCIERQITSPKPDDVKRRGTFMFHSIEDVKFYKTEELGD